MSCRLIRQLRFGLACAALLIAPLSVQAARQVTLAWDRSTDSTVTGYKVKYGTSPGQYSSVIDVGDTTTTTVSNLSAGVELYFAVTSYRYDSSESGPSNEVVFVSPPLVAPSIEITSPTDGSSVNGPAALTVSAQATDPDGTLAKVEFYQGATKLSERSTAPFSASTSLLEPGEYSFSAVAVDRFGGRFPSAPVSVNVARLGVSGPPTVRADGTVEIKVTGARGTTNRIWYSSDLTNWTLLRTVENTTGTVVIQDPDATKVSRRFYKVTSP